MPHHTATAQTVYCPPASPWGDGTFPFLSDDCQLVYFHVHTTPLSNPAGCFKASIEALAAEKRWPLDRYRAAFHEGLDKGLWQYDPRHHVVLLPRFVKWQKPNNPNVLTYWLRRLGDVPPSPLKAKCLQMIGAWAKSNGAAFMKAFEKAFAKYCANTAEAPAPTQVALYRAEPESPPKPIPIVKEKDPRFDVLWAVYPKPKNRARAEKAWAEIKDMTDELAAQIVAACQKQTLNDPDWLRDDGRFIPHPATWLHAEGWLDKYKPAKPKKLRGLI